MVRITSSGRKGIVRCEMRDARGVGDIGVMQCETKSGRVPVAAAVRTRASDVGIAWGVAPWRTSTGAGRTSAAVRKDSMIVIQI